MRAVKQKVWNEAENRERDWGETLKNTESVRAQRLLRHALPISLLILRKEPTALQSSHERAGSPLYINTMNFTFVCLFLSTKAIGLRGEPGKPNTP